MVHWCLDRRLTSGQYDLRTAESCTQVNGEVYPGAEECQMESDRQQNGLSETYMDSDKPFCLLQDSHVYSTETGEMTQC